jgi:hypothetical protein
MPAEHKAHKHQRRRVEQRVPHPGAAALSGHAAGDDFLSAGHDVLLLCRTGSGGYAPPNQTDSGKMPAEHKAHKHQRRRVEQRVPHPECQRTVLVVATLVQKLVKDTAVEPAAVELDVSEPQGGFFTCGKSQTRAAPRTSTARI